MTGYHTLYVVAYVNYDNPNNGFKAVAKSAKVL